MRFKATLFLIALAMSTCHGVQHQDHLSDQNDAGYVALSGTSAHDKQDTLGFISDCNKINSSSWSGNLQGVNFPSDSLGPFCFYECYDCKETYELVLVGKRKILGTNSDSLWAEFSVGCASGFREFNCFVFVYPMTDPEKQDDVHAMNVKFPVNVKVYKRTSAADWLFEKSTKVRNLKELSTLRFNTIYDK